MGCRNAVGARLLSIDFGKDLQLTFFVLAFQAVIIAASLIQFDTSINGDVADAGASLVCSSVVLHVVQRGGPSSSDVLMWRVAECKCSWS